MDRDVCLLPYHRRERKPTKNYAPKKGIDRERNIVNMRNNYSINDIWKVSGFKSRSSVFRILNKYGVKLNRASLADRLGREIKRMKMEMK